MGSDMHMWSTQERERDGAKWQALPSELRAVLEKITDESRATHTNLDKATRSLHAAEDSITDLKAQLSNLVQVRDAIVEFGAAQQDPKRYDAARCRLLDLARQIK